MKETIWMARKKVRVKKETLRRFRLLQAAAYRAGYRGVIKRSHWPTGRYGVLVSPVTRLWSP